MEGVEAASAPVAPLAAVEAAPRAVDVAAAPSDEALDFSGLKAFNADLELITHAVLVQHMRIDRARSQLVINDGYLASTMHNVSFYGGSARGRLEIDAREAVVRITAGIERSGRRRAAFPQRRYELPESSKAAPSSRSI